MGPIPASPDARNVHLLLMMLACLLSKTVNSWDHRPAALWPAAQASGWDHRPAALISTSQVQLQSIFCQRGQAGAAGCARSQPARNRRFLSGVVKTIVWFASRPNNLRFRPKQTGPSTPREPPMEGLQPVLPFAWLFGAYMRSESTTRPTPPSPPNLLFCDSDRPCPRPAPRLVQQQTVSTLWISFRLPGALRGSETATGGRATHCNSKQATYRDTGWSHRLEAVILAITLRELIKSHTRTAVNQSG
jgi:hypothetical protein